MSGGQGRAGRGDARGERRAGPDSYSVDRWVKLGRKARGGHDAHMIEKRLHDRVESMVGRAVKRCVLVHARIDGVGIRACLEQRSDHLSKPHLSREEEGGPAVRVARIHLLTLPQVPLDHLDVAAGRGPKPARAAQF